MGFRKGNSPWNKGLTKKTDSRIKKQSESMCGRVFSEEHRKNLRESHKGQVAWNKGITKELEYISL